MKDKFFLKKIKINEKDSIELFVGEKVFAPNLTTYLLIKACKKIIDKKKKSIRIGMR